MGMLRRILCKENIIETATTGREGLAKIQSFVPDIILLDLMLPDIDGYQLCRTLRGSPELHQPAIIIISARSSRKDKLHAYQAGADDYIIKPFFNEELTAKILAYSKLKRIESIHTTYKETLVTLSTQTRELIQSLNIFTTSFQDPTTLPLDEQAHINAIIHSKSKLHTLLEINR